MAGLLRSLASLSAVTSASRVLGARTFATGAFTKKDVVNFLASKDVDPDTEAAIRAYVKDVYAGKAAAESAEPTFELAAKVEKKYVAAQVVEQGIQNIAVPLGYDSAAPVKRYVEELLSLGAKAGFEDPVIEVQKRVAEKAATADTVKELLASIKPYASADFHAALTEAAAAVEAETNAAVTLDGSSAGYKKFAEKVKAVCEASKLPWKTLVDVKTTNDEAARKAYAAWLQGARVADAKAELEVLRADATALLDRHLAKSAEQIRTEQAAALASLQRKIDGARGAPWAAALKKELEALAAFDAAVAKGSL